MRRNKEQLNQVYINGQLTIIDQEKDSVEVFYEIEYGPYERLITDFEINQLLKNHRGMPIDIEVLCLLLFKHVLRAIEKGVLKVSVQRYDKHYGSTYKVVKYTEAATLDSQKDG